MSEHGSHPPPGPDEPPEHAGPPSPSPSPPPGYGPPPPGCGPPPPGYVAPGPLPGQAPRHPGMLGAAHKPGAIALRPLGLGDMFDGAFRIIRFNPRATVGAAVLVATVAMGLPVLVTALVNPVLGSSLDLTQQSGTVTTTDLVGFVASFGSLFVGTLLLQVGLVLVTGLVAHVTHAAAIGRRLGLGEAWALTRGKRWRLLGLALLLNLVLTVLVGGWVASIVLLALADVEVALVVLYGVLSGLLVVLPLSIFFYVRCCYLAAAALVLDPVGMFGAVGRAFRLSSGQFWRIFGIALLTSFVAGAAGYVLGLPFGLAGQLGAVAVPEYSALVLVSTQALSTVLSTAFTAPFTSAVTTLQYLDQRIRKEAYDVELTTQAGITGG